MSAQEPLPLELARGPFLSAFQSAHLEIIKHTFVPEKYKKIPLRLAYHPWIVKTVCYERTYSRD
jgi:hypothetical protein